MAMDRAVSELHTSQAETLQALHEGTRRQLDAQMIQTPPPQNLPPCDIHSLATYLPSKERKAILAQIKPLASERFPEPPDLGAFWLQVEEALRSIHPSLHSLY